MKSRTHTTSGLSTKDNFRGEVEQELAERQEQLREEGDIVGSLLASAGGAKPSEDFIKSFSKGKIVINQMDELVRGLTAGTDVNDLEKLKDGEGEQAFDWNPISGWIAQKNPWDTDAQEINAIIQGAVPNLARGVFGEVGVLTDRDIALYKKTLPNLQQTEDVQKAVAGLTLRVVRSSLQESLLTQADNGRNVSGNVRFLEDLNARIKQMEESLGIVDESSFNLNLDADASQFDLKFK